MGTAKKVLYSVGGGKVKESLLTVDDTTGAVVVNTAGLTVQGGGITVTGSSSINGSLAMYNNNITGLPTTPGSSTSAASKAYVDTKFDSIGSNSHVYTMDNTVKSFAVGQIVAIDTDGTLKAAGIGDTDAGAIGIITAITGTSSASITVAGDGYAKTATDISALANGALVYLAADGAVSGSEPSPSTGVTNQIVIAGYVVNKGTTAGDGYIHLQLRPFGVVTGA